MQCVKLSFMIKKFVKKKIVILLNFFTLTFWLPAGFRDF